MSMNYDFQGWGIQGTDFLSPPPPKAMAFEAQYLQLLGVVLHVLKIGHGHTSAGPMFINHKHFHTLLHFCPEDE